MRYECIEGNKEKAAKNLANIFSNLSPAVPAPKRKAMLTDPYPKNKPKPAGAPEIEEVASEKPRPNSKDHPEGKNRKGKGKGDGKDTPRGRSTSVDKKKILCKSCLCEGRMHIRKSLSL